jgi:hypothetical protein
MGAGTNTIYAIRGEHANHFTTNVIAVYKKKGMESFRQLQIQPFEM